MSADQLLIVAFLGFLLAGIAVATLVALIDNVFIYKRRERRRSPSPAAGALPPDAGTAAGSEPGGSDHTRSAK